MSELKPDLLPETEELISYIGQYSGRCRDCADEDGVCPGSGLPCDQSRNTKAIKHVLHAINYGVAHGYLPDPRASKARATTEVEVGVKPLVWREHPGEGLRGGIVAIAEDPLSKVDYQAWGDGTWCGLDGFHNRTDGTLADGKVAAQLDYATRIRSALVGGTP